MVWVHFQPSVIVSPLNLTKTKTKMVGVTLSGTRATCWRAPSSATCPSLLIRKQREVNTEQSLFNHHCIGGGPPALVFSKTARNVISQEILKNGGISGKTPEQMSEMGGGGIEIWLEKHKGDYTAVYRQNMEPAYLLTSYHSNPHQATLRAHSHP